MSGNGSPGNGGNGNGFDCLDIYRGAMLSSPQPAVVTQLKTRDRLELEIREVNSRDTLVAITNGQTAGSIISSHAAKVIECIQKGYQYYAVVTDVDGGAITLDLIKE
jgi:hypothetical protein